MSNVIHYDGRNINLEHVTYFLKLYPSDEDHRWDEEKRHRIRFYIHESSTSWLFDTEEEMERVYKTILTKMGTEI